ncbi:MAG: LamG domain-containing protein [Bacteroidales bacterium]|nr:LamG domain-containing protein [Bacteroidales bacterium]
MDETSGTLAKDASGNAQDGRLVGGLSFDNNTVTGINGNALQFDGTDDRVSISRILNKDYPRTISAWVKFNHTYNDVAAFIGDAGKYGRHLAIGVNDGKATIKAGNGTSYSKAGTTLINDNNWHLITGVFTNETTRHLYVDGLLEAADNISVSPPYINRFTVGALEFQAYLSGPLAQHTPGTRDQVT